MNEAQFLEQYTKDIPIFTAWGDYVNSEIKISLSYKLKDNPIKDDFLRIPPKPRIKDHSSIIAKAFWRGKNYTDPYNEITDKVGVRYVVLLIKHIEIVSEVIREGQQWDFSLDRDFEQEKTDFPFIFDYQSVHFVLKNKSPINYNGITIPINVPCEVQIRTLLQHSCCELTQDTIYKKEIRLNPIVYRSIAKSRALTESADDVFSNVADTLAEESNNMNRLLSELNTLYQEIRQSEFEEKSNVFILNSIIDLAVDINISDIRKFIMEEQPAIKTIILSKSDEYFIYRQPVVLLLYYLIQKQREQLKISWPLPPTEIQPLFADLGISSGF